MKTEISNTEETNNNMSVSAEMEAGARAARKIIELDFADKPGRSKVRLLSEEQREELDTWLFEENKPYPEVLGLLKSKFGLEISKTTLSNYYQRSSSSRTVGRLSGMSEVMGHLESGRCSEDFMEGAMKVLSMNALELAMYHPEDVNGQVKLMRAMIQFRAMQLKHGLLTQREKAEKEMAEKEKHLVDNIRRVLRSPKFTKEEKLAEATRLADEVLERMPGKENDTLVEDIVRIEQDRNIAVHDKGWAMVDCQKLYKRKADKEAGRSERSGLQGKASGAYIHCSECSDDLEPELVCWEVSEEAEASYSERSGCSGVDVKRAERNE